VALISRVRFNTSYLWIGLDWKIRKIDACPPPAWRRFCRPHEQVSWVAAVPVRRVTLATASVRPVVRHLAAASEWDRVPAVRAAVMAAVRCDAVLLALIYSSYGDRTTRRQTNSRSVKSRTGQLSD